MALVPTSEINKVHQANLGSLYPHVVSYLKDFHPERRRSYTPFLGSVIEFDDSQHRISFQDERILPEADSNRTRILLLFSNAHPESIRRGMFHTAESGIADLWTDLCSTDLFSGDRGVLSNPDALRVHCLQKKYSSRFVLGFATYWIFPTFHPKHLKELFRKAREPNGFENTEERLNLILNAWNPIAIICFNGEVFEDMTGISTQGYTRHIEEGLFQGIYETPTLSFRVFLTYPAAWRYVKNAENVRRRSLQRIVERL